MDKASQGLKNEKMKLYDDCLIFFLKKNICTDALPSTIQNDIFALRKLYQVTCTCAEKTEILEYCTFSHSLWWEDKLENIGTVCLDWDEGLLECYEGCLECYEWKRGDDALEEMSEDLARLRDDVKAASMKIPKHLSHLTDRIASLCNRYICVGL